MRCVKGDEGDKAEMEWRQDEKRNDEYSGGRQVTKTDVRDRGKRGRLRWMYCVKEDMR